MKRTLKECLEISDDAITFIFELSIKKYMKGEFGQCLSLIIFIAVLVQEEADIWYRAGIVAQLCEKSALALQLYTESLNLDPTLIGPKLFSVECLIKMHLKTSALELYNQTKTEFESEPSEEKEKWEMAISGIETLLFM